MKNKIKTLAAAALLMLASVTLHAGTSTTNTVTFAWDQSSSPNIIAYTVYSWTGTTTNTVGVGNTLSGTVSSLVSGVNYSFAVTATDNTGAESPFSNVITYTPPFTKPIAPGNFHKIAP